MNHYAIGYEQEDGTMDIDERDFMAANAFELLALIGACHIHGFVHILERVEVSGEFNIDEILKEQNRVN